MRDFFRKKSDLLKKVGSTFITIAGMVLTIVGILQQNGTGSGTGTVKLVMATAIYFIALVIVVYSNAKLKARWNGLSFLAHRGHVHTIRMILMRDYQMKHSKDEAICTDITKNNDFIAEKAEFTFLISKSKNRTSDVEHKLIFDLKVKHKGVKNFSPWIFGENDLMPQECYVKIGKGGQKRILVPHPVKNLYVDYCVNDSIYEVSCSMGNLEKGEKKHVELSYKRLKSYKWNKEHVFIIYPNCFAKKIEYADFKVEFDEDVMEKVELRLNELFCDGSTAREKNLSNFSHYEEMTLHNNKQTIYIAENIKINMDNVYALKISQKNTDFDSYIEKISANGFVKLNDDVFEGNVMVDKDLWNELWKNKVSFDKKRRFRTKKRNKK